MGRLCEQLAPHAPEVVCGPLLGGALLAQPVAGGLDTDFCFTEPGEATDGAGLFRARYRLPPAFHRRVRGRRPAIVDDVVSTGSSLRATRDELLAHDASPVAVGTLLALGGIGLRYFMEARLPVEAVTRRELELWPPEQCPLCATGEPLDP